MNSNNGIGVRSGYYDYYGMNENCESYVEQLTC